MVKPFSSPTIHKMYLKKLLSLLAAFVLPLCIAATKTPAPPGSSLELIESQKDLTLVAGLIRNHPDLVALYSKVKNVTIFLPPDSTFTEKDPNSSLYTTNAESTKSILKAVIVEGLYPASAITTVPRYLNTKLTSPKYVDTSRGKAVAKLVETNGKKTVDIGVDTSSYVVIPVSGEPSKCLQASNESRTILTFRYRTSSSRTVSFTKLATL